MKGHVVSESRGGYCSGERGVFRRLAAVARTITKPTAMARGALVVLLLVPCMGFGAPPMPAAHSMQSMPKADDGLVEYQVISIDPQGWITTARETATGNVVKFRLPPSVFHGQTFDADLNAMKSGQVFSVHGPRNTRLNNLVLEEDPPVEVGKQGRRMPQFEANPMAGAPLTWEILHVDPREWIVMARNRQTQQTVKFKVDPASFNGFRFRASLKGIGKGQGFSLVAPNEIAMGNCCTLVKPGR